MANTKTILKRLLFPVYVLVCGEIIMRVIAGISVIPDIELMVYAKDLTRPAADAALATEHVPGASAMLMGHKMLLNDQGHRSPPLSVPKPANEKRIYFMGTSITLGWGVGQTESFPAVVGELLTKTPKTGRTFATVNAGVANYNTINEAALLRRDLETVKPDAVIMQYYPRDAEANAGKKDNAFLKTSYLAAFLYRHLQGLLATSQGSLADHFKALHRDGNPDWRRTKQTIRDLKALTHRLGIAFAVVLVPELRDPSPTGAYGGVYKDIKAFFAREGIDVIDPGPAIHQQLGDDPKKGWAHPADPHPNAAVHRTMGKKIYEYLISRKGLLSP
ncbi:MAG: hypothetical protein HQ513_05650 [Rhodospirillales bacterium]|nr:hypothetical protein [Rhodospirillales bacterium]